PLSSIDAKWPREIGAKTAAAKARPPVAVAPAPKAQPAAPPPQAAVEPVAAPETKPKASRKKPQTPAEPAPSAETIAAAPEPAPKLPKPAKPSGALDGQAPVVDAPSIGPKTARRLEALGVKTVADLLALSAEEGESKLKTRHISADVIRDWQSQALLAC